MTTSEIETAVAVLRRSPQARVVFEAVYHGRQHYKTVREIAESTNLERKQVLTAGKRLADVGVVEQGKRSGDTAYGKRPLYQVNRDKILRHAASRRPLVPGTHGTPSRHAIGTEDERTALAVARGAPHCQGRPIQIFNCSSFHPEVTSVCSSLFQDKYYAEAVRTALTLFNNTVKDMAGRPLSPGGDELDGAALMTHVFNRNNPILRINDLRSTSHKDEQHGYMMLTQGAMIGLRNPRSHEHALTDDPGDAREMIGLVSYLMRRLDGARKRRRRRNP